MSRLSISRLAFAQRAAGAGIWDWDMITGKLTWSDELFRLFGLDPLESEASFETWGGVLHPEDAQAARERIETAVRERLHLQSEYRIVLPGGTVRWINAIGMTKYNGDGTPVRMSGICVDITGRKQAEEGMNRMHLRQAALSEAAEALSISETPDRAVDEVCRKVMQVLDCQVFFNFLVDEPSGRLKLNSCAGISEEEASRITRLDFGAAVCGTVALEGRRIVAEDILENPDPMTSLVASYGIRAYACHPLLATGGKIIGTLSFGAVNRTAFTDEELVFMKAVSHQVATATERHRMLAAERAQRAFFQSVIDLAPMEIVLLRGEELRLELANRKFTSTTGLDAAKDGGRPLRDLAADMSMMGTPQSIGQAYRSGSPLKLRDYEATEGRQRGRWWNVDGVVSEDGARGRGVLLVAREVTEQALARKRMERLANDLMRARDRLEDRVRERTAALEKATALAQAEQQRFLETLNMLPAYLILISPDYHVPFANRFFEERYGKSEGRRCFEYLFGRDEPCDNCQTFKVLTTNAPVRWEWAAPDGRIYDIHDFPFTDMDGSPLIMEVGLDITQHRRDEQSLAERTAEVQRQADQLRALTVELSQAEQRERKRLSKILHDHIQQLLVAARLQLEWLKSDLSRDRLQATVRSVDSIMKEALEASRSLTIELSPPVLHQAGLIGGLNWLGAHMLDKHQFTVHLRADSRAEPDTEETRFLIFECVRELLFNALKHAGVAEAEVTILRLREGIKAVIRDGGTGFDAESWGKQAEDNATYGLFSIQQRLAHFGGQMEIQTAPGKGTTVTLIIPVAETRLTHDNAGDTVPADRRSVRLAVRPKSAPHRVLIVDDHKIVREGLVGLMRFEPDIEVVGQATSGQEAIKLAEQLKPDVIVMDVNLGVMSGVEATRAILAGNPQIKVIGLSMYSDPQVAAEMQDAGAAAYLTKGGPSEDLISAIRASCP